MSTKAPWPGANGSSEQPIRQDSFSHHQEVLDRQMIQHLLNRYGHNGLSKLIRDEVGPREYSPLFFVITVSSFDAPPFRLS